MLPQPVKTHVPSIFQLIISLIGLVTSVMAVVFLWFMLRLGGSMQTLVETSDHQVRLFLWLTLVISLVSIPSLIGSIRRLARLPQKPVKRQTLLLAASIAFLVLVPLVFLYYQFPSLLDSALGQVVFTTFAVAVPLWWFVELGSYKLRRGSLQRFWGLINFEVFAGMPLIIFFEVLVIAAVFIIGGVWLVNQVDFAPLLMTLQTQLMIDPQDLSLLSEEAAQLIQTPGVMVTGLLVIVILIPLVEEIFKPLALWFFIKRQWSPAEGFSAGLICGAAFALVESLTAVVSVTQDNWLPTLIARVGTGLLHILASGLTGWALVSAWRDRKFIRLAVTYLISALLHGTWNFFAILYGLDNTGITLISPDAAIVKIAPWMLGVLIVGMLGALIVMNKKLQNSITPPIIPSLPAETIG